MHFWKELHAFLKEICGSFQKIKIIRDASWSVSWSRYARTPAFSSRQDNRTGTERLFLIETNEFQEEPMNFLRNFKVCSFLNTVPQVQCLENIFFWRSFGILSASPNLSYLRKSIDSSRKAMHSSSISMKCSWKSISISNHCYMKWMNFLRKPLHSLRTFMLSLWNSIDLLVKVIEIVANNQ